MRIDVKIHAEDSNLVERKYYEHAAGKDNISFLMKDSEINREVLQDYINIVEVRFFELQKLKTLMSKKYEPSELKGKSYTYTFNFEDETIIYEEK
jgi:hypothetical protein